MISAIIWYVFIGVAFNFAWDLLTTRLQSNENRFTLLERIIVLFIWPIAIIFFLLMFFKTIFSNKD